MRQRHIILIAHNLRSCHNVGSLFRTAEGLGISKLYLTGYTPYPVAVNDKRMPHIALKAHKQINKTALGADKSITWEHLDDIFVLLAKLKSQAFQIVALEQTPNSQNITAWNVPPKLAVIVGRETFGLEPDILSCCDTVLEIPMQGKKESFNVVQAAAMALFYFTFAK